MSSSAWRGVGNLLDDAPGLIQELQARRVEGIHVDPDPGPAGRNFDIVYQVVCPEDVEPTGRRAFSGWGLLGDYGPEGTLVRGMPNINEVLHP